ncbi:hypothetical protein [Nocardia sp. BMG51109]|uniref:hypothetical protein n=1 Tax=Nocardia sp. BMG51109 TaxID=1056816 RepID=UPI0004670C57|nr:hypothetical protein [Nocardia sp. BMG51109]
MNNSEADVDVHYHSAFQRLMGALDSLATKRIHSQNTTVDELCVVPVTDELMTQLAASPTASMALRLYAQRVASGEARWNDIELWAVPVPPEVGELKASQRYEWQYRANPKPTAPVEGLVRTFSYGSTFRPGEIVGPSDWTDDNAPQSWLQ